mmetsp:Transcript_15713/g.52948  ORF Transcript_15713/g.52948 Transcript_15713/m.52948 type:complete len:374 (+) Transcript_15713:2307-3428(+)
MLNKRTQKGQRRRLRAFASVRVARLQQVFKKHVRPAKLTARIVSHFGRLLQHAQHAQHVCNNRARAFCNFTETLAGEEVREALDAIGNGRKDAPLGRCIFGRAFVVRGRRRRGDVSRELKGQLLERHERARRVSRGVDVEERREGAVRYAFWFIQTEARQIVLGDVSGIAVMPERFHDVALVRQDVVKRLVLQPRRLAHALPLFDAEGRVGAIVPTDDDAPVAVLAVAEDVSHSEGDAFAVLAPFAARPEQFQSRLRVRRRFQGVEAGVEADVRGHRVGTEAVPDGRQHTRAVGEGVGAGESAHARVLECDEELGVSHDRGSGPAPQSAVKHASDDPVGHPPASGPAARDSRRTEGVDTREPRAGSFDDAVTE